MLLGKTFAGTRYCGKALPLAAALAKISTYSLSAIPTRAGTQDRVVVLPLPLMKYTGKTTGEEDIHYLITLREKNVTENRKHALGGV